MIKGIRGIAVFGLISMCAIGVAEAKTTGGRQVERSYVGASGLAYPEYVPAYCLDDGTNCSSIPVELGERSLWIGAEDAVAPNVALGIFPWDGNTTNPRYTTHYVCGEAEKPISLPRWARIIWIEVLEGPCTDGTPAAATSGTITATFSTKK